MERRPARLFGTPLGSKETSFHFSHASCGCKWIEVPTLRSGHPVYDDRDGRALSGSVTAPSAASINPLCNRVILSGAHSESTSSLRSGRSGVKGVRRVILPGSPRMERKRRVQSETTSSLRSGRGEIHSESASSLTLRALRSPDRHRIPQNDEPFMISK